MTQTRSERNDGLGIQDGEVERLCLQHQVWRSRALDAWRRAGFTVGQSLLDVGSGPGYASFDLADIVGPKGKVCAVDRSARFVEALRERARRCGYGNIAVHCRDMTVDGLPVMDGSMDGAWCRWIFAFLRQPAILLDALAAALRPGGALVLHEYLDYRTWRLAPRSLLLERFVSEVVASWRDAGGEPDIALDLPGWLTDAGFEIRELRPMIDVITPASFVWQWPASFIDVNLTRLVELGRIAPALAGEIGAEFQARSQEPSSLMITPTVLEIIAVRR
ncbi:methyltransferase domain-containing protein [Pedomonas mirosovicensis]|uniref:methyltransferase domain-containing protein n=1 Tax=Pedomonas mirosovicensis TaxID=2908641 RepID=UPI002168B33A|nr:methyltransferase domain-containing protein [Pedomonas mirosovicensis]MCH8683838.1 methyltransferase domain-containing protein [Pedomonas mirosovicensis]